MLDRLLLETLSQLVLLNRVCQYLLVSVAYPAALGGCGVFMHWILTKGYKKLRKNCLIAEKDIKVLPSSALEMSQYSSLALFIRYRARTKYFLN